MACSDVIFLHGRLPPHSHFFSAPDKIKIPPQTIPFLCSPRPRPLTCVEQHTRAAFSPDKMKQNIDLNRNRRASNTLLSYTGTQAFIGLGIKSLHWQSRYIIEKTNKKRCTTSKDLREFGSYSCLCWVANTSDTLAKQEKTYLRVCLTRKLSNCALNNMNLWLATS